MLTLDVKSRAANRLSLHEPGGGVRWHTPGDDDRGDLGFTPAAQHIRAPLPLRNLHTREWAAGILDKVSPGHWFRRNHYDIWHLTTEADALVLEHHLSQIIKDEPTGFDFETTGWSPRVKLQGLLGGMKSHKGLSPVHPAWKALPVTFQISWGQAAYVVSGHMLHIFGKWLTEVARIDGANLGFEVHVCHNVGINLQRFHRDALQMHYLWDEVEHQRFAGLKDLSNLYLGLEAEDFKSVFDPKKGETYDSVLQMSPQRALAYAALDPLISTWLAEIMEYLLSTRAARPGYNSAELYHRWERPFQSSLIRMEETGMPLNVDAARVHHRLMTDQIAELDAAAYKTVGKAINLSSPRDLCRYYYNEKHQTVVLTNNGHFCLLCQKTITAKTNHVCPTHGRGALVNTPSVDDVVLERFAKKKDKLALIVQKRRTIDKARGTWVDGYYKYASGKAIGYPSINGAHVVSGRLSAGIWLTTPEYLRSILGLPLDAIELLQAIMGAMSFPKGVDPQEEQKKIAQIIQATGLGKDWAARRAEVCASLGLDDQELVLLGADYSQLELRILTQITSDQMMADAFMKNRDLHSWTGALLEAFRKAGTAALSDLTLCEQLYEEIRAAHKKSEELGAVLSDNEKRLIKVRKGAKSVNFGMVYGMGADKLATELGCSLLEAQQIFEVIWSMYHMTKAYYDLSIEEVTKTGELRTLLGRNQKVPELQSAKPAIRGYGERLVKNKPCQCGAADIIRGAMIQVDIDIEAGGGYGRQGRGAYGKWAAQDWTPDWSVLPKKWAETGLPEALDDGLGSLGEWGFKMAMQCHDELVLIGPKKHAEAARARLKKIMETPFGSDLEMTIPLVVKTGQGSAWSALK